MINNIIEEETIWANEANEKREREKTTAIIFSLVITSLMVILYILSIFKIFKYIKLLKENKKIVPEQKLDYYREIPDETSTPAEVAFLYYPKATLNNFFPKIISATLLNLCYKKYISFDIKEKSFKRKDIVINILENKNIEDLKEDEKIIYELLLRIKPEETSFTIKEFKEYIQLNSSTFLSKLEKIKKAVETSQDINKNYDKEIAKNANKWALKFVLYTITTFFIFIWGQIIGDLLNVVTKLPPFIFQLILFTPFIINTILCFKLSQRFNGFTQKGVNEKEKLKALKRYMVNFSMLDDKEIPSLVIWEKYLIYATVFGVADKVINQLKIQFPDIENGQLMNNTTYMHLALSNSINFNFINSMNSSISSGYMSSGRWKRRRILRWRRPDGGRRTVAEAGR